MANRAFLLLGSSLTYCWFTGVAVLAVMGALVDLADE
jgi:hypothetical protein